MVHLSIKYKAEVVGRTSTFDAFTSSGPVHDGTEVLLHAEEAKETTWQIAAQGLRAS